jgi:hypothetical protein
MKGIFLFWLAAVVAVLPSLAQDRDQTRLQDHLMLKDGKMIQIRDQEQVQLQEHDAEWNGCPDGTYQAQTKNNIV